jgi:4-cresol dehydrogenase (hydroxylating)
VFLAPTAFYPRSFFVTAAVLPTYRDNPEGNKRTRELLINMVDELAKHGFGDYRTAPAFQDHLVSTYSFNNGALLKYQQLLKDATDPNGIIAPGRYGLWPAGKRPHA